jgi:hypothetical protein
MPLLASSSHLGLIVLLAEPAASVGVDRLRQSGVCRRVARWVRVCRPGHALQEDGLSQWSLDLIMRAS